MQTNNLIFGKRYVFFSSLLNSNFYQMYPSATIEERRKYAPNFFTGRGAQTHFSKFSSFAMGGKSKGKNDLTDNQITIYFQQYMMQLFDWFNQIIMHERQVEINFLTKKVDLVKKANADIFNLESVQEAVDYLTKLNNGQTKEWDYKKIYLLFNVIRKDINLYKKQLSQLVKTLQENEEKGADDASLEKLINADYKDKDGTIINEDHNLTEWMITHYSTYVAIESAHEKQAIETISDVYRRKINTIYKDVVTSHQFEFYIEQQLISNNINFNLANFEKNLCNYIAAQITLNPDLDSEIITARILNNLNQNLTSKNLDVNNLIKNTKKAITTSLEEIAIKKGSGLADVFLNQFNQDQKNAFYKMHNILLNNNFDKDSIFYQKLQKIIGNDNLDTAKKTWTSHDKAQLTLVLKAIIKNNLDPIQQKLFTELEQLRKSKNATLKEKKDKINSLLSRLKNKVSILVSAGMKTIKRNDAAELVGIELDGYEIASNGTIIRIPGHSRTQKTDVLLSVNLDPNFDQFQQDINKYSVASDFINEYRNFINNFSEELWGKVKSKLDLTTAMEIYNNKINNILKPKYEAALKEIGTDQKALEEFNSLLENQFFNNISTKDYQFYNNKIGFKGGNIGIKDQAVDAIQQIQTMYELGGISILDTNLLIEAVLNYTGDVGMKNTILDENGSDIIEGVKNYLLGGALLTMFNEGFSSSEEFMNNFKSVFGKNMDDNVHLYQFEGTFIPASALLTDMLNKLQLLTGNIEQDIQNAQNTSIHSSLFIINHIDNEDIPSNLSSWQERWNKVSRIAQDNTTIHLLLAAGLLDVFEDLQEAFNRPIK